MRLVSLCLSGLYCTNATIILNTVRFLPTHDGSKNECFVNSINS